MNYPLIKMRDGHTMPQLGLGTYQARPGEEIAKAVDYALRIGYRHIDTAAMYDNEHLVCAGIKWSRIARENIFITSKVWPSSFGREKTKVSFEKSLEKLETDYLDLYLLHWPNEPEHYKSWECLIELQQQGRIRSIGVSNFSIRQIEQLVAQSDTWPVINQVEFSPFNYTKELLDYCQANSIILEAYAPLTRGYKLGHPVIKELATKHDKTPAQILLRWAIQHGVVVIPKSRQPKRIRENADIFDFILSEEEMARLDQLDEGFKTC